jgi:hypothetical protein
LPADDRYQCFPHVPSVVRRPDVSFIRCGRLPGEVLPMGWGEIPPDLAVDVVSPNDSASELEEKLDDYQKTEKPAVTPGQNEKRDLAGAWDARTGKLTWVERLLKTSPLFLQRLHRLVTPTYQTLAPCHWETGFCQDHDRQSDARHGQADRPIDEPPQRGKTGAAFMSAEITD